MFHTSIQKCIPKLCFHYRKFIISGFADQLSWLRTRLIRAAEGREEDGTACDTFFQKYYFHQHIQALSRIKIKHSAHNDLLGFLPRIQNFCGKTII